MGTYMTNSTLQTVLSKTLPKTLAAQGATSAVDKDSLVTAPMKQRSGVLEIQIEPVFGLLTYRYHSLLVTLASDHDKAKLRA
jgi:hypothetical protein